MKTYDQSWARVNIFSTRQCPQWVDHVSPRQNADFLLLCHRRLTSANHWQHISAAVSTNLSAVSISSRQATV